MTPEEEVRALLDQIIAIEQDSEAEIKATLREGGMLPGDGADFFLNPETGQMTSRELLRNSADTSPGLAFTGGAAQGALFQYGDELAGLGGVVGGAFREGVNPADMGKFRMEQMRANFEKDREEHPYWATAGEVAGVLPYAVASGMALPRTTTLGGSMAQSAGMGTMEGFLYGSGRGEGLEGRAGAAVTDSIIGAGVGAGAPLVVAGARGTINTGRDLIGGGLDFATGRANEGRAGRAIAGTLDRAGMSVDDVERKIAPAALAGQPEYRVMDALGLEGQRRANGLVRSGGESGNILADFLDTRQSGATDRVGAVVKEQFGLLDPASDTAQKVKDALLAAQSSTARTNYAASRAGAAPVNLNNTISVIDDALNLNPILGESALSTGPIGKKLLALRGRMQAGGEQLIDYDTVLQIKQDIGFMGEQMKGGFAKLPQPIKDVYFALDGALEASSAPYRIANDTYAAQSRVIDAVDGGTSMAGPGRAEDTIARASAMTPDELAAARAGYGDKLLERIDQTGPTGDPTRHVIGRPKVKKEMRALAESPREMFDRLAREKEMFETFRTARTGSNTANNQVDIAEAAEGASGLLDMMRGGIPMNAGGLVSRIVDRVAPVIKGQNDATRKLIVEMLMSRDAQDLLPGVSARVARDAREKMVESLLRGGGRAETGAMMAR